jgi:hypothetical protein
LRSFSRRTFSAGHWLKKPQLLRAIAARLLGCSGFRQIGRVFGVSPQTVARHASRLGRQAILFHARLTQGHEPNEPLALDGFMSFQWSQYFPIQFHVLVGRESHFFYGFTVSEVRRSGRMTSGQRRRRAALEQRLGRPDPRSIEKEVASLLAATVPDSQAIELTTDEHESYPRALRRLRRHRIVHRTISSRAARTTSSPLFAVNLLDLLIRHSNANHKRETIAFSRRLQSAVERLWLFLVWRNYVKSFSEKRPSPTPAQRAGVTDRRWRIRDLFRRRVFPDRLKTSERIRTTFEGRVRSLLSAATEIRPPRYAY